MVNNRIKSFRVPCILLLGVVFLFPLTQVAAEVVWVEDWENGSSDWIFWSYSYEDTPGVYFQPDATATPSVVDGVFQTNAPSDFFGDYWSGAVRNSSVAYGSWCFDVIIGSGPTHHSYLIFFFSVSGVPDDLTGLSIVENNITGYFLVLQSGMKGAFDNPLIRLETPWGIWGSYAPGSPIEGSHHFHITRSPQGEFNVYFDPVNSSSPPLFNATHTNFVESTRFAFGAWVGDSQVDNFAVWNEVVPPLTDPTTTTTTTTTLVTTTTDDPDSTTTTTAAGGPGFEIELLVLSLSLLFVFSRKRRP